MKITRYSLIAGVMASMLAACSEPETPTPVPATAPSSLTANILFVNASPDAPQLNFFINNIAAGTGLTFPNIQESYNTPQAGPLQFRAKAASGQIGGTLGSNDVVYRAGSTNNTNFTTTAGKYYTVFVTDTTTRPKPTTPAGVTDQGGLRLFPVEDIVRSAVAGKAFVRFINLSPNAQALELVDADTKASILPTKIAVKNTRTNKTDTVRNAQRRPYLEISKSVTIDNDRVSTNTAAFTAIDAGSYALQIINSNVTLGTGVKPLTAPIDFTENFEEGKLYTIFVRGLIGVGGAKEIDVELIKHPTK
ncbi:DUF4397 domain-containing protein [Cytophagaceae bacterium DM2B3-1]|uniref:DUF4397 domain-containing protein n=1 Tax=Xanthocytophaga flava TaxID=3048013 RepID=A0ABT7CG88_9BACT|nr:DUF4397 domain-containing protein [Xanthocytophaga flavus]MDJ1492657.1 DUF4397 domain-containing protein [Xanthocytophaga flavus]